MRTMAKRLTQEELVLRALKTPGEWHSSREVLAYVRKSQRWADSSTVSSTISRLRRKGEIIESKREGDRWSYRWVPPRVYTPEEISDVKKRLLKMIRDV